MKQLDDHCSGPHSRFTDAGWVVSRGRVTSSIQVSRLQHAHVNMETKPNNNHKKKWARYGRSKTLLSDKIACYPVWETGLMISNGLSEQGQHTCWEYHQLESSGRNLCHQGWPPIASFLIGDLVSHSLCLFIVI